MVDLTSNIDELPPLPTFEAEWQINIPYEFEGLGIVIEYLSGDIRTKIKDSGITVSGAMPTAYGYILRTTDIHGDEIDMYLANSPDRSAVIYVIDQVNPGSNIFDEHKVMLGFGSIDEVVHNYHQAFQDGSGVTRLGAITQFSVDMFKEWLSLDGSSLSPASKDNLDGSVTTFFAGVNNPPRANPPQPKVIDEAGGVVVALPDLSGGPKLITGSNEIGCFKYTLYLYSALDQAIWSTVVDTFCRTLDIANENDTVHIHLASPGGSVVLLGRIVSAIAATKAKVVTYAEGEVASAAVSIWAAGHERHILPGAYFMQHMSSQFLEGKTTVILAKSHFCMEYIKKRLYDLVLVGLFTTEEIEDMVDKSADVFVSGREAISRMGAISYSKS